MFRVLARPGTKKVLKMRPCPYPKLKSPPDHVARRAFLRGCVADLPLSERGQPANKGLVATACKPKKDLGKDKKMRPGLFGDYRRALRYAGMATCLATLRFSLITPTLSKVQITE